MGRSLTQLQIRAPQRYSSMSRVRAPGARSLRQILTTAATNAARAINIRRVTGVLLWSVARHGESVGTKFLAVRR